MSDFVRIGDEYFIRRDLAYISAPYDTIWGDFGPPPGYWAPESKFSIRTSDGRIHVFAVSLRDKFLADMGLDKL